MAAGLEGRGRLLKHAGLPLVLAVYLAVAGSLPLASAFKLGGDEGYELLKGYLCSQGFELYSEIWNDQPPLHTGILSGVFRLFGPSVLAARLLTVGFGVLLLVSLYWMASRRAGPAAGTLTALLVVFAPSFLELGSSAMLGLPAFAMGLAAVALILPFGETGSTRWLWASGLWMGLALQIKLTAAILWPAVLVELMRGAWRRRETLGRREQGITPNGPGSMREVGGAEAKAGDRKAMGRSTACGAMVRWLGATFASGAKWLLGVGFGFGLVYFLFPPEDLRLLVGPHFSAETREVFAEQSGVHEALKDSYHLIIGAGIGAIWVLWRRRWGELFVVVMAASVYLIHWYHRPYWWYYDLHLAIPMAWLGGIAAHGLCAYLLRSEPSALRRFPFVGFWLLLVWSGLMSVLLVETYYRGVDEWHKLRLAPRIEDKRVLEAMDEFRAETRWVYASSGAYAFHARFPVPPELAVVPQKRRRTGRIDPETVVEYLRDYKVDQILVHSPSGPMKQLLEESYERVETRGGPNLWVRSDLARKRAPGRR